MSEWDEPIDNSLLDKLEKREALIAEIKQGEKQIVQGKGITQKEAFKRVKNTLNKRVKQFNKKKR